MKHAIIALAAAAFALPAMAQNAGEIEKVRQGGASCVGCNLFQADFSYREMPNVNLSNARLRQSDLTVAVLDGANLSGANLSITNAYGVRMTGANLSNADLTDAVLVGAYLGGVNLKGARLNGANLSGAYLVSARGLTQSQLNTACGDAATELPGGMTVPRCR